MKILNHYITIVFLVLLPLVGYSQINPSDGCAGVPVLPVNAGCVANNYTVSGAFANGGLVNASCNAGTNMDDGWYQFVATNTTTDIDLTGNRNHTLAVWDACGGGTELACDYALAGNTASVSFTTVIGTTYYVQVHRNQSNNSTSMSGTICIHDPIPVATDCSMGIQVCSNSGFPGNSSGFGVQELNVGNRGCLNGNEHQSSWYYLSIGTSGTFQMTISPVVGTDDYDFAIWGPAAACPPAAAPIRCSYAAGGGNTGVNSGLNGESPQTTEGSGGDRYIDDMNVLAGEVYLVLIDNFSSTSTQFNLTFGGSATMSCIPLSIELKSFTVVGTPYSNIIEWTTSSELNNDFFTVEKSIDGDNWEELGFVDGGGNSSQTLNYHYVDRNPIMGYSFYRLKQTDFDGLFEYSKIEQVYNDGSDMHIYPNPTNGLIYVSKKDLQDYEVTLTNSLGQYIEISSSFENGLLTFDLSHLPNGIYYILLSKNGVIESNRFVLRH